MKPVIVNPTADELVAVKQGTPIFTIEVDCESEDKPTAELWVDLGWEFYKWNVSKIYNLPVELNGDGRWTVKADIITPWAWGPLPQVNRSKRWVEVRNADGVSKSPTFQIKIE